MKHSPILSVAFSSLVACSGDIARPTVVSSADAHIRLALVSVVDDHGVDLTAQFPHVELFTTLPTVTYSDGHDGYGNPSYAENTEAMGTIQLHDSSLIGVAVSLDNVGAPR